MLTALIVFYLLVGLVVGMVIMRHEDGEPIPPNPTLVYWLGVLIVAVLWLPMVVAKKVLA